MGIGPIDLPGRRQLLVGIDLKGLFLIGSGQPIQGGPFVSGEFLLTLRNRRIPGDRPVTGKHPGVQLRLGTQVGRVLAIAIEEPLFQPLLDRALAPFNRRATRQFLKESRQKVWRNAQLLSKARRAGGLDDRLGELERLSARRVADLRAPGQVVMRLARDGFGVELTGS
jgi:hypothetical protein